MRLLIGSVLGFLIAIATGYFSYQAGYNKCVNENEKATLNQAVDDAKALTTIKLKQVQDHAETERIKTIIKTIPDPTGCAGTAIPGDRVDRMRDAYYSGTTGSGTVQTGGEGTAEK